MATTEKPHGHPLIPRVHGILSLFYPQLFESRTTLARLNKESNPLGMDGGP